MKNFLSFLILSVSFVTVLFADVLITEIADPNNNANARYLELYNSGDDVVALDGMTLQRWTNGNADPTSTTNLTGNLVPGGFFIACKSTSEFSAVYGMDCDISGGSPADSNGDDQVALFAADGTLMDFFGVAGEDGTNTWHEFEDGRVERNADQMAGCMDLAGCESLWTVDGDNGNGDGAQDAPDGYDPGAWIGAGEGPTDVYGCMDVFGLNFNSEATADDGSCEYADHQVEAGMFYYAPQDLVVEMGESVQWNNVSGMHDVVVTDGPEIFSMDVVNGPALIGSYTFTLPGTYSYICSVGSHADQGMVGTVTVNGAPEAANLFFSEYAEGSSNNKYLEIFNATDGDVDLSDYSLSSCSNGCDDGVSFDYPNNVTFEAGTMVASGDVFVVCHGSASDEIAAECDQTFTYLSNGDDVFALTQVATGDVLDLLGLIGDDPGSGWEVAGVADATKNHTLVRNISVASGNADWAASAGTNADDSEWIVLDEDTWTFVGSHPHDFVYGCMDEAALNYNADANLDDGSCEYGGTPCVLGEVYVSEALSAGDPDYIEIYNSGSADCSLAGFMLDDSDELTDLTFGDVTIVAGGYWVGLEDADGSFSSGLNQDAESIYFSDGVSTLMVTMTQAANAGGEELSQSFGADGSGCYTSQTPGAMNADCYEFTYGCTDELALNYNPDADWDDESCEYEQVDAANIFFSEYAEGSSNNKYLEIFNATDGDVDLGGYTLSSCSNGCNTTDVWDYADNVTFDAGTMVAPGDVYVVCHGSSDEFILGECDQTFSYLSNGDDVFALTQAGVGTVLDIIGTTGDDPGSGWEVAGVSNATKDHTLVRKSSVESGTTDWAASAGTSADDSQWSVLDQNDWSMLGYHVQGASVLGCMDPVAMNYDSAATEQEYNEYGTSTCTYASCADIPTAMGCLFDDGTSAEWWEGWWNCTDAGGQVCGLHEVVFELNLPEDVSGTPHVNGSYNGWCGSCYNNMSDDDGDGTWTHVQYFGAGETHDYKFTTNGWDNQEDLTGLGCAVETDGYWNRQFTTGDANTSQTQTFCWGTCEETCDTASSCGDGVCDENEDCSSCSSDCGECAEYTVTFDLDGVDDCGFVSVTGTFDNWSGWGANTDTGMAATMAAGDYEFIILCVNTEGEWWNDIWGNSTVFNAPIGGDCWNGNDEYANYTLSVAGDMTVSYCAGTCDEVCEEACTAGDVNGDSTVDVLDVVSIVSTILDNLDANMCADMNADGNVDVLDVVSIVSIILDGRITSSATEADLRINSGSASLDANGFVGAVQMTLSHGAGFSIELTDKAMVADYRTNANSTTLIIVAPESDELFTASGDFNVEEIIVANENSQVTVGMPTELTLSKAYPNPFNPSTSMSVYVPADGVVSLSVYNVMGQEVATLHSGNMTAGNHTVTWNASNMTTGMYFVRAESSNGVAVQKVMLMK